MARIEWSTPGEREFEAGVDRGVLYVGSNPGVPWNGLIEVNQSRSGGEAKPRYLDGMKISNYATPEEFEATIEAFMYPPVFEQCDGTLAIQNGLKATQQRRKSFGMVYRTGLGDDLQGLNVGYKLHILYNLRAEPSDRAFQTLNDETEPVTFNWNITSRGELVPGFAPTAHFTIDSRDVPAELLQTLEDILYGDEDATPSLPSAGELVFLFDSYDDLVYDAGSTLTPIFSTHDAGSSSTPVTSTIDSGGV